jgi:putative restriction endonuclease
VAERRYYSRLVKQRLHQAQFRTNVLAAYGRRCTVCRLKHAELLDAAHILPDHQGGEPVVPNGLASCKIHHSAFDRILGVRPDDHTVEIREDVLDEHDGPMLRYGIQAAHGTRLHLPRDARKRPDRDGLEQRYEEFRAR